MRRTRSRAVVWLATVTLVVLSSLVLPGAVTPAGAETVRQAQWHLEELGIARAHQISRGAGVIVGVIDSGVAADHPSLRGQVLPGKSWSEFAAPDGRTDSDTEHNHGTGVASVIVGRGAGDDQVLGIAPEAKVLPVSTGIQAFDNEVAPAIRWAVDHGAKVINISLGGPGRPRGIDVEAVRYASDHDVVIVSGAGNIQADGVPDVQTYGLLPGAIVVGATQPGGGLWPRSSVGSEVGLAAPGDHLPVSVTPTVAPAGWWRVEGTSVATAVVSGVVALVRARYPDLDAANVINRLVRTARDRGAPGRDPRYGFGIVDPVAALTADVPAVSVNPLGTAPPVAVTAGADVYSQRPGIRWGVLALTVLVGVVLLAVVVVVIVVATRRRPPRTGVRVGAPWPPPPAGGYPPGATRGSTFGYGSGVGPPPT